MGETHATTDQCKICRAGRGAGDSEPVFFTDDYAYGLLKKEGKKLTWTLIHSVDDSVLDSVVVTPFDVSTSISPPS